ncbi:MAG: ATP-grasp domain-containing protein [Hyphomicrobium sp.]
MRRYYQQRLDGEPHSVLALAGSGGHARDRHHAPVAVGSGPRPYRYGGAVGPVELPPGIEDRMRAAAAKLCAALGLIGLVSFDFLIAGDTPYLLEVNPRPSATLDVFDDAAGTLFKAHLAACAGAAPPLPAADGARAAVILYADEGPLLVQPIAWPPWTAGPSRTRHPHPPIPSDSDRLRICTDGRCGIRKLPSALGRTG